MTADEIFEEWKVDGKIDRIDLGGSLLDKVEVRQKYIRFLHAERAELRRLETRYLSLVQLKTEYLRGDLNGSDQLKELGWEPMRGITLKEDMARKIATDKAVVKLSEMIGEQKEKISVITGLIDTLKSYSFDIRGAIEWQKYLAG